MKYFHNIKLMDPELIREKSIRCRRPCRERPGDPASASAEWRGPPEDQQRRLEELCRRIEVELAVEEALEKEQVVVTDAVDIDREPSRPRTWKSWTEQEIAWLQLMYDERKPNEKQHTFAQRAGYFLDRSADSVICRMRQMGLRMGPTRKRRTKENVSLLVPILPVDETLVNKETPNENQDGRQEQSTQEDQEKVGQEGLLHLDSGEL